MGIYNKLFDYQKQIVDTFKNRRYLGLFLDMGLGKTPISLSLSEINGCKKLLIITINSKTLETENDEGSFKYWLKQYQYLLHVQTIKDKNLNFNISNNECLICNYESLFKRKNETTSKVDLNDNIKHFIQSCQKDNISIIIDESHKMKNTSSLQTCSIFKIKNELILRKNILHIYELTGTPFTSEYLDLYSQLKLLGYDETKTNFIEKYCIRGSIPGLMGWQQPIVGYKNVDDLMELVHQYAITIKSEEVVKLPPQIFINHIIPQSRDFTYFITDKLKGKMIYDKLYTIDKDNENLPVYAENKAILINNPFYRNIDYPSNKFLADTMSSFYMRSRQVSIGFIGNKDDFIWYNKDRLKALELFLKDNPDNYVLFYNFVPELVELYKICEKLNYKIDIYSGEIKSLFFYNQFKNLNEESKLVDKKRIILSNFASGSTGMNWQQYNKVIMFSLPTFKDYSQSIKRVHRTGQKNPVYYHLFYSNNWLDKKLIKSLKEMKEYDYKLFEKDLINEKRKNYSSVNN